MRFFSAAYAQHALQALDQSLLGGQQIMLALDANFPDGTKIIVTNMPAGVGWQELKTHFSQVDGRCRGS